MTVTTAAKPVDKVAPRAARRRVPTWVLVVGVVAAWIVVWAFTRGHSVLALGAQQTTPFQDWLTARANDVQMAGSSNVFMQLTHGISSLLNAIFDYLQTLISIAAYPRPVPQIGWLGVVAIAGWVALAAAGWRMSLLVVGSFLSFGLLGYWSDSMDLLIVTLMAVAICLLIGIPIAVWMGNSKVVSAVVTPVLDLLQTLPSFVYLLPLFLLFGLGAATAVVTTLLYALPPVIRIAAQGIRSVSPTTIEATRSMGQTTAQRILKVQLPMAKSTVIVGINQTTMAALSMATIAAYINGPGLGQPVIQGLELVQVGKAFVPGLAIVIMAIMLDRTTTAISERSEQLRRAGGGNRRLRLVVLAVAGIMTLVAVYLSRMYLQFAQFPKAAIIGPTIAAKVQAVSDWISTGIDPVTGAFKDKFSYLLLNPLQDLVANSPWWLAAAAILAIALVIGGRWAALSTVICLAGIYFLDLWHDTMITLTMTLVATVVVMVFGLVFGVWMGRSMQVDRVLRPILDAGQTMPPFVYLIPVLALFQATRFTAIVAAIIYAAPAAIKIIADGIRGVSSTTMEAATAAGSNRWQLITKVQLPMARGAVTLAANQGLLYVLSMVVIGGLVGAGALGYDVVDGFTQITRFGKGLAAGLCIVLLGVMLDRITRGATTRSVTTRKAARRPRTARSSAVQQFMPARST